MSAENDGGPAFPVPVLADKQGEFHSCHKWGDYMLGGGGGMSLRDWFAGQVLSAEWLSDYSFEEHAALAYKVADAMLAERSRQ